MSVYFNEKPEYIEQCLISILNNSILPFETVIVFDGPVSSEIENVFLKYAEKLNVKLVRLQENLGLGFALNAGLEACTCSLIARMDADDICEPNRFAQQLHLFAKNNRLDLAGSVIVEYDDSMINKLGVRTVPLTHDEILKGCKLRNPFNHMTVMFKKTAVMDAGGYQPHLFMEDYNLWIRMITAGAVTINVTTPGVKVRAGSAMIERRKGLKYIKSEWQLTKLKIQKKLCNPAEGMIYFVLRSAPRLFSVSLLKVTYRNLRK